MEPGDRKNKRGFSHWCNLMTAILFCCTVAVIYAACEWYRTNPNLPLLSTNNSDRTNARIVMASTGQSTQSGFVNGGSELEDRRSEILGPGRFEVNCSLLMSGDKAELGRVRARLSRERSVPAPDRHYVRLTRDCDAFRRRGYVTNARSLHPEERSFPVAFALRMHRSVAMAERLLRAIYRPHNVYCLHVDRKSPPDVHDAMRHIAKCFPNVKMASKLESFVYSSFSAVAADLTCMKDLSQSKVKWKYFLNMAGSEYPLKTNLEMVKLLKLLNGTNDIEQVPFPELYRYRINQTYRVEDNKLVPTGIRKDPFPGHVTLQKGCSYNTYSRAFVLWLLSDPLARDFITWTRDLMAPDEVVWGTLNHLQSAPGGYQEVVTEVAKSFLSREIIWRWSAAPCTGGRYVRAICILSSGDLPWLRQRWEMIANKFDLSVDPYVVQCLEEALLRRTAHPMSHFINDWDYVRKFPQFRGKYSQTDHSPLT